MIPAKQKWNLTIWGYCSFLLGFIFWFIMGCSIKHFLDVKDFFGQPVWPKRMVDQHQANINPRLSKLVFSGRDCFTIFLKRVTVTAEWPWSSKRTQNQLRSEVRSLQRSNFGQLSPRSSSGAHERDFKWQPRLELAWWVFQDWIRKAGSNDQCFAR